MTSCCSAASVSFCWFSSSEARTDRNAAATALARSAASAGDLALTLICSTREVRLLTVTVDRKLLTGSFSRSWCRACVATVSLWASVMSVDMASVGFSLRLWVSSTVVLAW